MNVAITYIHREILSNNAQFSTTLQEQLWRHFSLGATLAFLVFCVPLSSDGAFWRRPGVGKLLTRSTRFTCFCTAQTSIFQKMFVKLFRIFRQVLAKITHFQKTGLKFTNLDEKYPEFQHFLRKFKDENLLIF